MRTALNGKSCITGWGIFLVQREDTLLEHITGAWREFP